MMQSSDEASSVQELRLQAWAASFKMLMRDSTTRRMFGIPNPEYNYWKRRAEELDKILESVNNQD